MPTKRKKATKKQLSDRAKKGWITRRRHIRGNKLAEQFSEVARRTRTPAVEKHIAKLEKQLAEYAKRDTERSLAIKKTEKEKKKAEREEEKERKRAEVYAGLSFIEGRNMGANIYDWMKLDYSAARFPSRLRRLPDTEKLRRRLDRIVAKHGMSTVQFGKVADEFHVDVKEVFSLYMSP